MGKNPIKFKRGKEIGGVKYIYIYMAITLLQQNYRYKITIGERMFVFLTPVEDEDFSLIREIKLKEKKWRIFIYDADFSIWECLDDDDDEFNNSKWH